MPGFIRFQSLVRGYLQRQKYKSMGMPLFFYLVCSLMTELYFLFKCTVRNAAYRDHVAREILDTEKFYVKHLSLCVNVSPVYLLIRRDKRQMQLYIQSSTIFKKHICYRSGWTRWTKLWRQAHQFWQKKISEQFSPTYPLSTTSTLNCWLR